MGIILFTQIQNLEDNFFFKFFGKIFFIQYDFFILNKVIALNACRYIYELDSMMVQIFKKRQFFNKNYNENFSKKFEKKVVLKVLNLGE